jgi:dTDP-glucose pyrophosphorylase
MSTTPESLREFLIPESGTIRDAMRAIDANGREVALVRDETERIVGLVTDGDIRRGLLAGLTLESRVTSVLVRDFHAVSPNIDRAAVLDLMKARMFRHVPALDQDRRLVAIHFLHDLIGAAPKQNIAVVMAGGKGRRLWPMTETIPKPMIEVAGRPMLERIVLHLVGHGIQTIFLALNYKAEVVERHFGDGAAFGCRIDYLREPMPLGTGGALSLLPARPEHPLLVLNGDMIAYFDVTAMLGAHAETNAVATIGVGLYEVQIPFATVVEKAGRLVALEEKPKVSFLVSQGIYVLDPSILEYVPRNQEFPITTLFDELLAAKKAVSVFNLNSTWLDVGTPEDLRRARGST